jgi:hypothetical protein
MGQNYKSRDIRDVSDKEEWSDKPTIEEKKPIMLGSENLSWKQVVKALICGATLKLPEFKWTVRAVHHLNKEGEVGHVIRMYFADGVTSDTLWLEYMLRDDWEVVEEQKEVEAE